MARVALPFQEGDEEKLGEFLRGTGEGNALVHLVVTGDALALHSAESVVRGGCGNRCPAHGTRTAALGHTDGGERGRSAGCPPRACLWCCICESVLAEGGLARLAPGYLR